MNDTLDQILPSAPRPQGLDGLLLRRWGRRAISIGAVCFALLGVTLFFPLLAALALLRDALVPCQRATIRTLLFLICLLICEFLGVLLSLLIWVAEAPRFRTKGKRFIRRNYRLQRWWGCTLARAAQRIYRIRLDVEGCPEKLSRPYMLFVRHTSFADTFLPVLLLCSRFRTRLRYVMKTELLWDPCLDIVGHRVPNVFVDRYGDDSLAQIEAIRRLARGIGDHEGILMFPEGTRFTRAKQHSVRERLRSQGDNLYETAVQLRSVLPPRLGGTLAIVETARHADAVFCAHSGLEATVTLRDLLSGKLVGQCVRVRFWLVPAEQIPRDREAMRSWFLEQWTALDRLVTTWNQGHGHA